MSYNADRFKKSWRGQEAVIRSTSVRLERTSLHHKKPQSLGGTDEPRNLSRLPISRHQAWHVLFSNFTPERIAQEINKRYLDPDFEFIVIERHPPA